MKKRVILIVLDSAGIGELPDAALFGDEGSNTFGNIFKQRGHLDLPNMYAMGLSRIKDSGLPGWNGEIRGSYGKCAEKTFAKDTTCGHWEMAGLALEQPFKTFPDGFPQEFIAAFEKRIGRKTLCNRAASGTAIINELGDEHMRTGSPIVYTSADSVFQIAMHESVIPLEEQYRICGIARKMLVGEMLVGRVIARPFLGTSGQYYRTANRKDFAVVPFKDTIMDALDRKGMEVIGIGKIEDIFCRSGITTIDHTHTNPEGIEATLRFVNNGQGSFIFTNLVDFDMTYGHRNDVEGYASALEDFDRSLPALFRTMEEGDILIITADHGCDPTTPSTDHSREYIPVLCYGKHVKKGIDIGVRTTFADIGATVYEYLTGETWREGNSFLSLIKDID